ncbi:MAG: RluA family pseudouridine synthase [Parachlamydia sp.]|jgi:23S rRNA pseudouridine1911/1915/1917 synthase|nr:RluA family pseudouridine synthase [Parachlamydia sp.]
MIESDLIIIQEEEAGERLDKTLARRFSEKHSRTYFQYLIAQHLVSVNGSVVKKRTKLEAGDEIEVHFAALPEADLTPEDIPLNVVYEDAFILVINKPPGMVIHPAPGNWSGTFVNALLYHCKPLADNKGESLRPGIVHRIDKETSGLLVAAKTLEVQQKLIEQFASRQVYKEYLAICLGRPPEGEICAPIGRHPIHRKEMAIVPSGKMAITHCKVLAYNGKISVVQAIIATGRTHQIRVHLKYKGNPIIGDSLYGQSTINHFYNAQRQMLHASVLKFQHPETSQVMEFKADPPADMQRLMNKIRLSMP